MQERGRGAGEAAGAARERQQPGHGGQEVQPAALRRRYRPGAAPPARAAPGLGAGWPWCVGCQPGRRVAAPGPPPSASAAAFIFSVSPTVGELGFEVVASLSVTDRLC